jgi:hypothetical protein
MKPATAAYIGAALFVALMAAFSAIGDTVPGGGMLLLLGILGVGSHLVLLPVVSTTGSAPWARVCGYSWIAMDVILNVASINGMTLAAVMPLRLGSHILAAVWITDAALSAGGIVRIAGVVLALLLAGHALTAPWIPPWVLFIPFVMVPVWLALVGRHLQRNAGPAAIAASSAV